MSRSRFLRAAPLVVVASAAAVAVSGCASGFHPATSSSMKPRDGVNYPHVGNTSPVAIRHAFILGPDPAQHLLAKGDSAAIYLSVVNQTRKADRLVSADSPLGKVDVAPPAAPAGKKASKSVAAKNEASSKGTGAPIPAPAPGMDESDPVKFGQPPAADNTLTLTGLRRATAVGSEVKVSLHFQRAGTIALKLPVTPRNAHRATLSPPPGAKSSPASSPSHTGSERGSSDSGKQTDKASDDPSGPATE